MGQITPSAQEMLHPNMNKNGKNSYEVGDLILADDMNKDMNSIVHDLQNLYYMTTASDGASAPSGYDNTFIQYHRLNLYNKIVNTDIVEEAGIPYSKLSLGNSIKNDDIIERAGIPYSKLTLNNSIVNTDIVEEAGIPYSKLSLSGSIVDDDIAIGAAIKKSKINFRNDTGTDGTIVDDDVANISYAKLTLNNSIVNTDIVEGAGIPYSKLSLGGSIVDNDVAIGAAIQKSKLALKGTITKEDFNSASFTGDGMIPAEWIDDEHPVPYLPIRYDEGVLGRDGETGNLYQNKFTDKGYLTASDSDGRLVTTNITSSRANSVLNRSNITAGTGIPTWDVYGLITSSTKVYTKSININGSSYYLLSTSNNDLPSFYAPPAPNDGDKNKYLAWDGSKFVYATPSSTTKVTLNGTQTTNAVFWAPISKPSNNYSDATLMWKNNSNTGGAIIGKPIWKRCVIGANAGPAMQSTRTLTLNQESGTTFQPNEVKYVYTGVYMDSLDYKNGPIVVQTSGDLTGYYFIPTANVVNKNMSAHFLTNFILQSLSIINIHYSYSNKTYWVGVLLKILNKQSTEQTLQDGDLTMTATLKLDGFTRTVLECDGA